MNITFPPSLLGVSQPVQPVQGWCSFAMATTTGDSYSLVQGVTASPHLGNESSGLRADWERLKQHGNGAINSFQQGRKALANPGARPYFLDMYDFAGTFERVEAYLTANFGCVVEFNCHPGDLFLEVRKLPKGMRKLPSDLKHLLYTPHAERHVLSAIESLPYEVGLLISEGEAFLEFGRDQGRWGTHIFYVMGEYEALKRTFEASKKDPRVLRDFVGYIFEWANDADEKIIRTKRASRPKCERLFNYRGQDDVHPEPDITIKLNKLFALDVGEGYSAWQRAQIFYHRIIRHQMNLHVKILK